MIDYRPLIDLRQAQQLWNEEAGWMYPISDELFLQNAIHYPHLLAFGAYDREKLVGFLLGKICEEPNLPSYRDKAWISLFYTCKKYRRLGIGSSLFNQFETAVKDRAEILIGRDPYNFFPGVPVDFDALTDRFLEKRGYSGVRYTHDVINYAPQDYPIINQDINYHVLNPLEKQDLLDLVKTFGERWYYEVDDYFKQGGTGKEFVVGTDNGKVIAFARIHDGTYPTLFYNVNWSPRFTKLGGIGPLGVDSEYRKKQIGYDIVSFAIQTLKQRGRQTMIIDWTSILGFYQLFGFEVWKSYKYMSKKA